MRNSNTGNNSKAALGLKASALLLVAFIAGGSFLAGLFTHELIFPQRELIALQAQLEDLQNQVGKLSEQVADQQQQMKKLGEQLAALSKGIQGQGAGREQPIRVEVSPDDDPALGQPDAPVVIVEFSDYQCPFCKRFAEQTLPQIKEKYIDTGKVKLIFRDFPLSSIHPNAELAAEAAQCAHEQGKFWEMHDRIFQGQFEWSKSSEPELDFKEYAKEIGLDVEKFTECLESERYKEEIQKDLRDGISYGVRGTPTFFINGLRVRGAQPFSVFQQVIEAELAGGKE